MIFKAWNPELRFSDTRLSTFVPRCRTELHYDNVNSNPFLNQAVYELDLRFRTKFATEPKNLQAMEERAHKQLLAFIYSPIQSDMRELEHAIVMGDRELSLALVQAILDTMKNGEQP